MNKAWIVVSLTLMLAAVPAAQAANTLDVNAAAALGPETSAACPSGCGLEVTADGVDTSSVFVQDNSPAGETVYRAQFQIDPNTIVFPDKNQHYVLNVRQKTGQKIAFARVLLRDKDGIRAQYQVREDFGKWRGIGGKRLQIGQVNNLTIEVQTGAGNASARFFKNGKLVGQRGDMTVTRVVELVRFGAEGVDVGTTGSYYLDTFESFRTLAP